MVARFPDHPYNIAPALMYIATKGAVVLSLGKPHCPMYIGSEGVIVGYLIRICDQNHPEI